MRRSILGRVRRVGRARCSRMRCRARAGAPVAAATAPTRRDHHDARGAEDDAPGCAARARDLAARRSRGKTSTSRGCRTSRGCSRRARSPTSPCAACAGVPSLADGYVTIGAGTRSVGAHRRRRRVPRARRAVRRGHRARGDGAPQRRRRRATIPDVRDRVPRAARDRRRATTACCSTRRSARSATRSPRPACSAPRSATATRRSRRRRDADYRRWAPLALTDQNGIVPAGAVGSSLLERDPTAPFGLRLDPERVLAAFDRTWNEPTPQPVGRGRRGQRSPAAAGVRLGAHARRARRDAAAGAGASSTRWSAGCCERVDPAHDAVLVVAPSQRGGAGPARPSRASRAPGVKPGLAVSSWTRHSGVVSIVDIGPTILDQLGIEPPTRMEGRPIDVRAHRRRLRRPRRLDGRHQQGRAVPRPRDRAGHGLVRRAPDRADGCWRWSRSCGSAAARRSRSSSPR